ncbi:DUF2767 domain-containing protein [Erwinia sp. HR93]|uniref:DUF2767 domain-containing protein n=1 Tax=Erwinia sp. HR93 TaxID=3094840 RepID=UPI002ADED9DC|nr:DUF2767 domain-containing protein [Erwinia sp. HR93]MEA1064373.1 DUF2767 domain-containing protein [Erwinia sp. HR93]
MTDEKRATVTSIFGEALLELITKNREIGRDTLAMLIREKAEHEEDEEKILLYWKACHALLQKGEVQRAPLRLVE